MKFLAASLMGFFVLSPLAEAGPAIDDTASDVRCLIAYMQISSSSDPKLQTAGMIGTMYWLGRLDGRAPGINLESQIISEMKTMVGDRFRAEARRCGEILVAKGKVTTDMGRDLVKKGQEGLQGENSR